MRVLDAAARRLVGAGRAVSTVLRYVGPVDTNPVPREWTHVTKVDPELDKRLPLLYPLYLRHTSAVSVGGSRAVTARNTEETFALLDRVEVPAFHEPSDAAHVTERTREASAFLALPEVLNGDAEALVGELGAGIGRLRDELVPELLAERAPWLPDGWRDPAAELLTSWLLSRAVFEAYVVQNPDSAAAREANVGTEDVLDPGTAAERALAAEKHLGSEVLYLEYSGTYGGEDAAETLAAMDAATTWPRLWYGGGIDGAERAGRMLAAGADAVVVGDAFHEVAAEEAALLERAAADLPPTAGPDEVDAWAADAVGERSAAVRYLSTVPSVEAPESLARRYLATAVAARIALGRADGGASAKTLLAERAPDPDLAGEVDGLVADYATGVADADLPRRHLSGLPATADGD